MQSSFQKRASDPNRFFNRGCSLLKEEKQRKKLLKDLPRTEEVLKEEITKWEEQNGKEFLIGGVRFIDYVKNQWEEYTLEKEREKTTRVSCVYLIKHRVFDLGYRS